MTAIKTRVLFDSTRTRKHWTFGWGILASRPHYRAPYTAADLEAAARMFAPAGPDWDAMAEESAAMDRLEAGYCC